MRGSSHPRGQGKVLPAEGQWGPGHGPVLSLELMAQHGLCVGVWAQGGPKGGQATCPVMMEMLSVAVAI